MSDLTFSGFKRPDGKIGIRNKVLILPASVCASDTTRIIASQLEGAVTFNNQNGCSQIPSDLELTLDVMSGFAANPNIYGTVVVALGCENAQMDIVLDNIKKRTNKPLKSVVIQEVGGTIKATEMATRYARQMIEDASKIQREKYSISNLIIGTECGGSDTTSGLASNPVIGKLSDLIVGLGGTSVLSETTEFIGAEHLLAKRAKNIKVKEKILSIIERYENQLKMKGENIRDGNPSPGNKKGGLTTLEEKSLGCIHKGGTTEINEVYYYAKDIKEKGLVIMDTPGNDPSSVAGMVAGGCQIVVFSTGRGTPTGNPIAPVIKITANRETYHKMKDNTDIDVSGFIYNESTLEELGNELLDEVVDVSNGKKTKSEQLGYMEIGIMRNANYV